MSITPERSVAKRVQDMEHDDNISESPEHPFYHFGPKLILVTISLMLAVFCVALDNTVNFLSRNIVHSDPYY